MSVSRMFVLFVGILFFICYTHVRYYDSFERQRVVFSATFMQIRNANLLQRIRLRP